MNEAALTRDRILDTAEDVLRRYGPAKANVVDVARALGVSHGSVYRHFPSKAALRDAVTERWLQRISAPLAGISEESTAAPERLRKWLTTLVALKRQKVAQEPELFATYRAIFAASPEAVQAHVDSLTSQLARVVADGVARGEFVSSDPASDGRALFDATARFHAPAHAETWGEPGLDAALERVLSLLIAGLQAPGQ